MVTNMDADAQVPALYVEEVDRAAAAAEDPHLLVGAQKHILVAAYSPHAGVCICIGALHFAAQGTHTWWTCHSRP